MPNGVEMLPLLVGAPAEARRPAVVPEPDAPKPDAPVPGMIDRNPPHQPAEPASKPGKADIPDVAPGMVPRESDYHRVSAAEASDGPAMTVTDPEPEVTPPQPVVTPPAPKPAPAPQPARAQIVDAAEIVPVRPDVEPPEDDLPTGGKK